MPIHFRGFCSLDLAKWTFNLSKEPYSYEGLKLALTLRTIVYLKICKGLVSLDLLHDISRLFTPFGLWADYGAFQGNLNFSQTPYFFSWEIECAPGSTWNLGEWFNDQNPWKKEKNGCGQTNIKWISLIGQTDFILWPKSLTFYFLIDSFSTCKPCKDQKVFTVYTRVSLEKRGAFLIISFDSMRDDQPLGKKIGIA